MTKKLIVLLTKSDHDWAVLSTKKKFPQRNIAYLECEQSSHCSPKPLESERLLCVIRLGTQSENTRNIKKVFSHCEGCDVVIGTHTQDVPPEKVLDLSKVPNKVIANYSTGWEQFAFIEDWCEELAKVNPNIYEIREAFDRLFGLLKTPNRLEAYLDAMLNLAFDDKVGAVKAVTAYAPKIETSVTDAGVSKWNSIKKTILDWDTGKRETNISDLNDEFFQFAEKEFIDRYSYFGEIE